MAWNQDFVEVENWNRLLVIVQARYQAVDQSVSARYE
jgi:hypothetical protein